MTSRCTNLRHRAVALLDQQLWCWGRDVARPAGNAFLALGMCRYRSPERTGGSMYTGSTAGGGGVWLWGWGVLYCLPEHGGVFLRRYGFEPLLLAAPPASPVHRPDDLGPLTRPVTSRQRATAGTLVRAAAGWVAGYEHWVAETFGIGYREAALAIRNKPAAVPARGMAAAWEHLAKKAFRLPRPAFRGGAVGTLLAGGAIPPVNFAPAPRPWERRAATRQRRYPTA